MPSKAPSFQYYPKDWRADPVFTCSLAARGLWREMLDMMHAQEQYGYLAINGSPIPPEGIARYCGCSLAEYDSLLDELSRAGVPSRTSDGIIYSRRMVRDEKQRATWRKEQKNHRDTRRGCQGNVNAMSTPSSSSSSSAKTKPNPPTPLSGGQSKPRRLTKAQIDARVGSGPELPLSPTCRVCGYTEFFHKMNPKNRLRHCPSWTDHEFAEAS
jgi:hypothetical protein